MKLWGGRFSRKMDEEAWKFNASIDFDKRLGPQDVRGSMSWAKALNKAGLLSHEEVSQILEGLGRIAAELEKGEFEFQPSDEDIHTAVERRLGELIGPLAGKLHTGRSRNDQIATDLRLWLLDHLPLLDQSFRELQEALDLPAVPNIIEPAVDKVLKQALLALASWAVDALVDQYNQDGTFIHKPDNS